jgi:anti-sigma factor RsiW
VTCREFAEFMMGYLEGELAAEERRRFDEHLTVCPDCVRYLRDYRGTIRAGQLAYQDELPVDVPEDLVKAIIDARKTRQPS